MEDRELQERLEVLFWLIDQGWVKFGNVPQTVEQLKAVRRKSDGSFDLEKVEPLVRAMCLMVGEAATPVAEQIEHGVEMELPELDLPDVQRPRGSTDDFMTDLVKASNIVIRYLFMVASATPLRPLSKRERAIFPGVMVRLAKLGTSTGKGFS